MLTIIGIALFMGDGVITPAISILSAVEDILLIPGFKETSQMGILLLAALIAIGLFLFQRRGTDRVAWVFGPVMVVMFEFRSSENLASAYGLAVSGSMLISAVMMAIIIFLMRDPVKFCCAGALIVLDFFFFIATLMKIPHGASYFSFILAAIPLILTLAYIRGQDRLHELLQPIRLEEFLPRFEQGYASLNKIKGTALYFISDIHSLSPYVGQIFFQNEIMYENKVLVSIRITEKPFGVETHLDPNLATGLELFTVETGYMEVIDIVALLESRDISEKTIFYGIETIVSDQFIWKLYGIIKKVSPPFVQFYTLPAEKMHGVVTRVVM